PGFFGIGAAHYIDVHARARHAGRWSQIGPERRDAGRAFEKLVHRGDEGRIALAERDAAVRVHEQPLIALAVEAEAEVVAERDEGRIVIAQLEAASEGRWPARTGTGWSFGRRGDGHAPGNDQGQTRNGQRDGVRLLQGRE